MLRGDGVIRRPKGQISARFRCGGVDLADLVGNLDGLLIGCGRLKGEGGLKVKGSFPATGNGLRISFLIVVTGNKWDTSMGCRNPGGGVREVGVRVRTHICHSSTSAVCWKSLFATFGLT